MAVVLGTLVPVIGLVQVGGAAMADRYSYFPSIGIFLALALGASAVVGKLHPRKIIPAFGAGAALAACLVLSHRQLAFWRDDVALFTHALAVTKDNATAHINLGVALEADSQKADAMAEYRAALKLDPHSAQAHNNLANLLDDAGKRDEAIAEYEAALRLNPRFERAHNNYGAVLAGQGRFDDALVQYAEAARLAPDDWHPLYLNGKALLKMGRDAEAIPYFRKALQLAPNELHLLSYFAEVLASDENPSVRDGNLALTLASRANTLSGGAQPVMLDTLAMAAAELGRFDAAQQAEGTPFALPKIITRATTCRSSGNGLNFTKTASHSANPSPIPRPQNCRNLKASPARRERDAHADLSASRRRKIFRPATAAENSFGVEMPGEQPGVGDGCGVPLWRGHQDDTRLCRGAAGQRLQREQNVVDRAEPVWGDNQRRCGQRRNQIARIKILAQRA